MINAKVVLLLLHHNYHLIHQNTHQHIKLLIFLSLLINLLWFVCIWTFKGLKANTLCEKCHAKTGLIDPFTPAVIQIS